MQSLAPARDPAPSRLSYKLNRLWLRRGFRRIMLVGLPVMAISGFGFWYMGQEVNRLALHDKIAELRRSIEERPEFRVQLMAIDGASYAIAEDIREIVPVDFPVSSFDLDLSGMQQRIAELDAVEKVDIQIRQGGVLQVRIQERVPAAVWRVGGDIELLDAVGHRVAVVASRAARPDLPLLAGEGAQTQVVQGLALLEAAGPVKSRIRGLVRIGERRWDLVLDRGQRIMLPESNPMQALLRVMALETAQDLLARDIQTVDMRNPKRPTLRLAPDAVDDFRMTRFLGQRASDG